MEICLFTNAAFYINRIHFPLECGAGVGVREREREGEREGERERESKERHRHRKTEKEREREREREGRGEDIREKKRMSGREIERGERKRRECV